MRESRARRDVSVNWDPSSKFKLAINLPQRIANSLEITVYLGQASLCKAKDRKV